MISADTMTDPQLLAWQLEQGADEAIGAEPTDWFAVSAKPPAAPEAPRPVARPPMQRGPSMAAPAIVDTPAVPAGAGLIAEAEALAAACNTVEELMAAIRAYDGCSLKKTATNTVIADGVEAAPLMVVGEAPGADEDRLGKPFVGVSGQLLDRMLKAIGRDRHENAYITNAIYWRPPGNRTPTPLELGVCLPFLRRHVALVRPKVLLLSGNTAAKTLLDRPEGITRLRGRWFDFPVAAARGEPAGTIPVMATFHPSYLLRQPAQKREAWRDFLEVKIKLEEKNF